jgi:hypothetical protein
MDEIVTEHAWKRPAHPIEPRTKRNAMTSAMYMALAVSFNEAANHDNTRFVLRGQRRGLSQEPLTGPGESPQARLMDALVSFDKPPVAPSARACS